MNNKLRILLLSVWSMNMVSSTVGYELATHAKITNFAYDKSRLGAGDQNLLNSLGITTWTNQQAIRLFPFRAKGQDLYFDLQAGQPFVRKARAYELDVLEKVGLDIFSTTVRGWLMRGVIREDDGDLVVGKKKGEPLDARDGGQINRFCNHFLDPVRVRPVVGRGFSGYCFNESPVFDAATWSLGTVNTFDPMPYENTNRRNHFSVLDAREAMWRALTLRDTNGVVLTPSAPLTAEDLRKVYWATAFRTVGDVIHTLQDMGNPQHTRNEGHVTKGYEEYIDARARRSKKFTIDGRTLTLADGQLPDLIYEASYPVPRFSRYSDYWSTRVNSANIFGLSDYSNRGFFTLENNFGNTTNYTEPSNLLSRYTSFRVFQSTFAGYENHLVGPVEDKLTNSIDTVAMTTQSVFTGLSANGGAVVPPKYTLNAKNYDDRAALLIPRAVAYSAGLIDYFFRGQLEIRPPEEGVYAILDHSDSAANCKDTCGFNKIKLKAANSTPDIVPSGGGAVAPQIMTGGTLVAVAKYHKNTCYTTDLEGEYDSRSGKTLSEYLQLCRSPEEEITVSQPLANQSPVSCNATIAGDCDTKANASTTLTFNFDTPIPINATDLYLQVVYRGPLGSEQDAVVVATKDIAEPTYLSVVNVSDYLICYNNSWVFKDANGNLPATIPNMVDGKLATDVYKASNYNFWRITFQPVQDTTLARVDTVQPKEYARVAVLVEPGQSYNDEINGYVPPEPPPFKLVTAGLNQSGSTAAGSPTIGLFDYKASSFRKVKAHAPLYGYNYNTQGAAASGICRGLAPPATEPGYPPPTAIRPVTITFP